MTLEGRFSTGSASLRSNAVVTSHADSTVTPIKSSRPKRQFSCSGTIETINLDSVPQAVARLDNSAAKHKLSVKPKKQRVSRKHKRLTKVLSKSLAKQGEESDCYNGRFMADKLIQDREEQKQLQLAEEKKIEDHWGILEAERIRQIVEMEEQREMEEKRCQELEEMRKEQEKRRYEEERRQYLLEGETSLKIEEQTFHKEERLVKAEKRQELEQQRCQELEKQRQKELEEQQRQDLEEKKHWGREEQQRRDLEVQKLKEQEEQRQYLEEKKLKEQEEQRQYLEEKKLKEQEEQQRQELEKQKFKEQEEQQRRELEIQKLKKQEEQRRQELEMQKLKEQEERQRQELEIQKLREQEEKQKRELEEQQRTEGQNLQSKQEKSLEQPQEKDQLCSAGGADRHPAEEKLQEGSSPQKVKQPEKGNKTAEEMLAQKLKREVEAQEQKRIGEELRWQEVDERQTASRPFTFQVSSGDKQIIFQKVNLSPVMPIKGAGLSSPSVKDCRVHTISKGSHSLPSSVCVPHTAILVTGAQLCGTAVNLNQIKDTACKSLLGLTEERKNVDIPSPEKSERKRQDPKPSSSKMKHAQEALDNQAVLAELASIRSRILKNAENNKYNERDRVSVCRHSDDWTPRGRGVPHGNLRKTLSANAKFSITPAWQKFSESSKTSSDAENVAKGNETVAVGRTTGSSPHSKEDVVSTSKDNLAEKPKEKMRTHSEVTDNTEGCKFAKDLPSFLVPSFPHSTGKELPQPEPPSALENQQNNSTKKADKTPPNGEENASPFGIKLRRTNYSLRFHYDQQAEQKKKKRYSAGDSFDGVPDPLTSTEGEKESPVFAPQESTSPGTGRANIPGNLKDSSVTVVEFSSSVGTPVVPPATSQSALPAHEKPAGKSPVPQKPALAPKPTSQTPPSSPLSKINRSNLSEMLAQRLAKAESDAGWRKEDRANAVHPTPCNDYKNEEEEIKEKKSFFPSLSIPWREKNDKNKDSQKTEAGIQQKPVLQSRHSLDGSKLMEKVETSQPLWITLALQKQKGFREQQATREERRQAREAKQAEKLAKEIVSKNKSSSGKTSTLQKPTSQEGEKKIETAVSRLERREHLKKSNTLPTSVTVEISDSLPSTPVTKEVAKRFSTPDANPVSTEPAWLALAKRKAKAWSDCPQIIK
uniref:Capping protein inhibiting regulator of actin dynamics n=1 Tax=Malurus cyaneus samueli TaxID=2593467 RepID=A0A8C5T486_9PASS